MDGVLAVIDMLGATITALRDQISQQAQALAEAQQQVVDLEAVIARPMQESDELAAHARSMANRET